MSKTLRNKLVVILATIVIALVGALAISGTSSNKNQALATNEPPTLTLVAKNLSYADSNYVLYAIGHKGIENVNSVQMLFWKEGQTSYLKGTESYAKTNSGTATVKGQSCVIFYSNGIAAKEMADNIYARAYVEVNNVGYYSDLVKYSVLEYVCEMREAGGLSTAQENAFTALLNYGASIQTLLNYKTNRLANANFNKITVVNGTLADATTSGRYINEEKITITANEPEEGMQFVNWTDKDGVEVATTATTEITVTGANTYTANYEVKHVHDYSELKFDENNHWYECECGENNGITPHGGGTATCTEKAVCEGCGEKYGEPNGHDYTSVITAPKCEEQGYTTYTCHCGDSYISDYVDELGHNYGAWVSTGDNTHTKTCANDNSHKITENCYGGAATCTEKAVCEGCGESYGELVAVQKQVVINFVLTRTVAGKVIQCTLPEGYSTQITANVGDVLTLPTATPTDTNEYTFKYWKYFNDSGDTVKIDSRITLTQESFPGLTFNSEGVTEITLIAYCTANWSGYY